MGRHSAAGQRAGNPWARLRYFLRPVLRLNRSTTVVQGLRFAPLFRGRPVAVGGVRATELGTTRRRNGGRQVTLDGQPLYFYVDDAPGRVLCHNVDEFGGLWLVARGDGKPVA